MEPVVRSTQDYLISFESGHYKSLEGTWEGDSVWCHFRRQDGTVIHVNKDKVEYIQHKQVPIDNSLVEKLTGKA